MRVLVIDSHKGTEHGIPQNMHWQNAKILADHFGADLIWSYPNVNEDIKSGYDAIIFVHASHYAYTDYKWLEASPDARLFYITNEYNLGEPRTLWMAAKEGRKYDVIANHPQQASKVVGKYVSTWHIENLNALIYSKVEPRKQVGLFANQRSGCVYYGSFRKDRSVYFKKYLDGNVTLSTHPKNVSKFRAGGVTSDVAGRINWEYGGLFQFKHSLYIEDEKTHTHYNYLANRFYEAINYGCVPLFSRECQRTVDLSGYPIGDDFFIASSNEISTKNHLECPDVWHEMAAAEKTETLSRISQIIGQG